ncbi:MAG TPA: DUF5317 family protein, partial [Chloroflexota bacterium]|nr:DUF5317 family protein [Chloroflexota bacterium]
MLILFVAVAVVLGIFVAIRPVWRPQGLHESVPLPKKPWLLVVAVVVQALWVRWLSNLGPSAEVFSWILPASYLPVIYFLASNIRTSWAPVVALGVGLNLMVMIVNGGTMPAPARFASDQAKIALHAEPLAPASKDRF